jgi:hypothetical protein
MVVFEVLPAVPLTIRWLLEKPIASFREAFPNVMFAIVKFREGERLEKSYINLVCIISENY